MEPEEIKAKAIRWNDLQVLSYNAQVAGREAQAADHLAKAEAIERELEAAGTNIRALVCP